MSILQPSKNKTVSYKVGQPGQLACGAQNQTPNAVQQMEKNELAIFKRWLSNSEASEKMQVLWSMFNKDDEYPIDIHRLTTLRVEISVTVYKNSVNYIVLLINRLALDGYFVLKKITSATKTKNEHRLYKMTEKGIALLQMIEMFSAI